MSDPYGDAATAIETMAKCDARTARIALEAALKYLWQPIDSAPEGEFLAPNKYGDLIRAQLMSQMAPKGDSLAVINGRTGRYWYASHWAPPLPPPPTRGAE